MHLSSGVSSARAALIGAGLQVFFASCLLSLSACQHPENSDPVPESWLAQSLATFEPPDLLQDLHTWAPHQFETRYLILTAPSSPPMDSAQDDETTRARLLALDSLAMAVANDPMLFWTASRLWVTTGRHEDSLLALDRAQRARSADLGNALLDLWLARLLARLGQVHEARMLFFETANFRHADAYGPQRETWVLRALQQAGRMNAFSAAEAIGIYAVSKPFDLGEDTEVLREVFLDPLEAHPYDIRRRAPQAAMRLIWVGQFLRRQSLAAPGPLWSGLEERAWGYAFEDKGWEFLAEFGAAFERKELETLALTQRIRLQNEAETVVEKATLGWQKADPARFLDLWQNLAEQDGLKVGEALKQGERHSFWLNFARKSSAIMNADSR